MKKIFFTLALVFTSFISEAQTPTLYSKEYVVAKTDNFAANFNMMNTDQRNIVMALVFNNNEETIQYVANNSDLSSGEYDQGMKLLRLDLEKSLLALLTATQQGNFEEFKTNSIYF